MRKPLADARGSVSTLRFALTFSARRPTRIGLTSGALAVLILCGATPAPGVVPVTIVGYNDMDGIFDRLNAIFLRAHPEFRFHMRLSGTAAAPAALAFGVSEFAPMGAEFSEHELSTFRTVTGSEPISFRVAHCSLDPRAKSAPIGIFVNVANPLHSLTSEQVARIFTTGQQPADITTWGQLGLGGDWRERSIHPVGIAEEAAGGLSSFLLAKMLRLPFTHAFDGFPQSVDVVRVVSQDASAIGFASANVADPQAKTIPIDGKDVSVEGYPYDRFLLIYVRRDPGQKLRRFVADYLGLIFSPEGQAVIASAPPRYRPLTSTEITTESAKLNALASEEFANGLGRSEADAESASFTIMGATELRGLLEEAAAMLRKRNLQFKSVVTLQGNAAALDGLSASVATLAVCDRAAWPLETRPFRQFHGYEPANVKIGRFGYASGDCPIPPAVYVNAANPVHGMTIEEVKKIFVRGSAAGEITRWGQVGLVGEWAERVIHVYGLRDDGSYATAARHDHFDSLPFSRAYEPLVPPAQAARAVASDQAGIVLLDSMEPDLIPADVRLLPLARERHGPYSGASYDDVLQGKYPLSPYLHAYFDRPPGEPVQNVVRQYLELLLSAEGQHWIALNKSAGVVPLSPEEKAQELRKLE